MFSPRQKLASMLLRLLNSPSGISAGQIMEDYDLSERTFRNYIYELQNIPELTGQDGKPLVIQEKRSGQRYLILKKDSLPEDKMQSFFLSFYLAASLMNFLSGTRFYAPLEEWARSLKNNGFKIPIRHIEKKLYALHEAPKNYGEKSAIINPILRAVVEQKRIDVLYQSRRSDHPKLHPSFRPYTLMEYRHGLYLIGHDEGLGKIIYLSIDRVKEVTLQRSGFQYPSDYSPSKFTSGAFGMFRGDGNYRVELVFAPTVKDLVRERNIHPSAIMQERKDGTLHLGMTVNALEQVVPWVLSFGEQVTVKKPETLKNRIKDSIRMMAENYPSDK